MRGRIIPTILGKEWRFLGVGSLLTFWSSDGALELSWPLWVSFSLLIEDQGLAKVDLSAILDPFDSNRFMLYPWVMSFFKKLCPAPFPPFSKWTVEYKGLTL